MWRSLSARATRMAAAPAVWQHKAQIAAAGVAPVAAMAASSAASAAQGVNGAAPARSLSLRAMTATASAARGPVPVGALSRGLSTMSPDGDANPLATEALLARLEVDEHGRQSLALLALTEETAKLAHALQIDGAQSQQTIARIDQLLSSMHALVIVDPAHRAHRLTLADYRIVFHLCAACPSLGVAHASRFAALLQRQMGVVAEESAALQHEATLQRLCPVQVRDIAARDASFVVEDLHQLLSHGRFVERGATASAAATSAATASGSRSLSIDQLVAQLQSLYPNGVRSGRPFTPTAAQQAQARTALQALFDAVPAQALKKRFAQRDRWPFVTYAQFRLALHVISEFGVQDLSLGIYPRLLQQQTMWTQLQSKKQSPSVNVVPGWLVAQLMRAVSSIPESGPVHADAMLRHMMSSETRPRLDLSRLPEVALIDLAAAQIPTDKVERLQRLVEMERLYEAVIKASNGATSAQVHAAMFRALVGLGEHDRADQVLPLALQSPGHAESIDSATLLAALKSVRVRMGTSLQRDPARDSALLARAEALWLEAKARAQVGSNQLYNLLRCHAAARDIPRQVELLQEGLALEAAALSEKLERQAVVMVPPRCFAVVIAAMAAAPNPAEFAAHVQEMYAQMQVRHTAALHRREVALARELDPARAVRVSYLAFFQRLAAGYNPAKETVTATVAAEALAPEAVLAEAVRESSRVATAERLSALLQEAVQEQTTEQPQLNHAAAVAMNVAEASPVEIVVALAAETKAAEASAPLEPELVAQPILASAAQPEPVSEPVAEPILYSLPMGEGTPAQPWMLESSSPSSASGRRASEPAEEVPADGLYSVLSRLQGLVPFTWMRRRRATQRHQQALSSLLRAGFATAEEAQAAMSIASRSDIFARVEARLLNRGLNQGNQGAMHARGDRPHMFMF